MIEINTENPPGKKEFLIHLPEIEGYVPQISRQSFIVSRIVGESSSLRFSPYLNQRHYLKNKKHEVEFVTVNNKYCDYYLFDKHYRLNNQYQYRHFYLGFGIGVEERSWNRENYITEDHIITHLLYVHENQIEEDWNSIPDRKKDCILIVRNSSLEVPAFRTLSKAYPKTNGIKTYRVDTIPFNVTPFEEESEEMSFELIRKKESIVNKLIGHQLKSTWKSMQNF